MVAIVLALLGVPVWLVVGSSLRRDLASSEDEVDVGWG
jgi:hypothetical protein